MFLLFSYNELKNDEMRERVVNVERKIERRIVVFLEKRVIELTARHWD